MTANPYAAPVNAAISDVPEYGYQDPAYAVPDKLGPYDAPGDPYAPRLSPGINGVPDTQRTGGAPIRSYRVNPDAPDHLWAQLDADKAKRESVTRTREQFHEQMDGRAASGANRFAPRPGLVPPPPGRATSDLSPSTYSFRRTDGQNGGTPRRLNGDHMSLATHKRTEPELFGVMPRGAGRSSERLDVLPWGTNVVNRTPRTTYPNGTVDAVESPVQSTRAYRLG